MKESLPNSDQARRRLAAILAANAVGYTRLMPEDVAGTLAATEDRTGAHGCPPSR
jgi:hypothetical protein